MLFCEECRFKNGNGCELYPEGTAEVERTGRCHYFDKKIPMFDDDYKRLTTSEYSWGNTSTTESGTTITDITEMDINGGIVLNARNYTQIQQESGDNVDLAQLHESVVVLERLLREVIEDRKKAR